MQVNQNNDVELHRNLIHFKQYFAFLSEPPIV